MSRVHNVTKAGLQYFEVLPRAQDGSLRRVYGIASHVPIAVGDVIRLETEELRVYRHMEVVSIDWQKPYRGSEWALYTYCAAQQTAGQDIERMLAMAGEAYWLPGNEWCFDMEAKCYVDMHGALVEAAYTSL